jgi:halogenation protein CepH
MARQTAAQSASLPTGDSGAVAWDPLEGKLPVFQSSVVRQVMREGAQVQAQALLGEDAEVEAPLFDNGLVPSADGMFWSVPSLH